MQAKWVDTRTTYHEIIAAPDAATREKLYLEGFIAPWKPMMDGIGPMFKADPDDPLAVARAWAWLLPDDLAETPSALTLLEEADAWRVGAEALAEGVSRFEPYAERIPFDEVTGWLVLADAARADPTGRGYTGGIDFTQPVMPAQFDTPNDYNLPRLPGLVVHEMHHLVRLRAFLWGPQTSVADYVVMEGLAESFAAALFGEDIVGYYVTDFDEAQLDAARKAIGEGLDRTGFDVIRAYVFGDFGVQKHGLPDVNVPAFGGYATGYRVVQAFLQRTGRSIEEATFLPAGEIISESGFFG